MTDLREKVAGWQPIDERYEVSSTGQVRRSDTKKLAGQWQNSDGYYLVRLSQPRRQMRVHRLVAEAFLDNPDNKPFVNHINNSPADNRAENLEWCTQQENLDHASQQGRMQRNYWLGRRSPNAKLSDVQVREIRTKYRSGNSSYASLAKEYGVSKRAIGRLIKDETYV